MKAKTFGFLIIGSMFLVLTGFPVQGNAGVNINIGVDLPVYTFPAPPPLVVIPGTYAYYVPDSDAEIVFYHGYWYRPYEGRWYIAREYNGPWGFCAPRRVPAVLLHLPPRYREARGYRPIPYGQVRRNWAGWERDRYWDRGDRHEHGRGRGHDEWREERHGRHRDRGDRD